MAWFYLTITKWFKITTLQLPVHQRRDVISWYENARWPAKVEVKGLRYSPRIGPKGVMGFRPGPRTGWWSGHRHLLFALRFPGPRPRAAGGGAGPADLALSRGSSRRGRPGREAGGQRRRGGPPPTGAAPGPSKSRAGSLLFLAGT